MIYFSGFSLSHPPNATQLPISVSWSRNTAAQRSWNRSLGSHPSHHLTSYLNDLGPEQVDSGPKADTRSPNFPARMLVTNPGDSCKGALKFSGNKLA